MLNFINLLICTRLFGDELPAYGSLGGWKRSTWIFIKIKTAANRIIFQRKKTETFFYRSIMQLIRTDGRDADEFHIKAQSNDERNVEINSRTRRGTFIEMSWKLFSRLGADWSQIYIFDKLYKRDVSWLG